MNGSPAVRLGRVFGIQIGFDVSWLFVLVLMTWSLMAAFAHLHPQWSLVLSFATALAASLLFFASVLLHELAHSLVARGFGVPVASITLFLFGGVSNIEREPPSPKVEFLTAVVGPLTSILLGLLLLAIAYATSLAGHPGVNTAELLPRLGPGATLLLWLGPINIVVGVFNLIPGFPLDGGRILRAALWQATKDLRVATQWAAGIGQAIGWGLVMLGVAITFGANVPFFGRGIVSGLWVAFIGWFLAAAAAQTWRRQVVHDMLEGLTVSRVMRPVGTAVTPQTQLESLVDRWLTGDDERAFPVVDDGGRLLGLVALSDVRRVPREAWRQSTTGDVMTPRERLLTASPQEDLADAFDKLVRVDVGQLPVVDRDGRLVGSVLRRDIARWIELHVRRPAQRYAH
jgi:Zn-dependent protease/CBS domain-containing protein